MNARQKLAIDPNLGPRRPRGSTPLAGRADCASRRHGVLGLKPDSRRADYLSMRDLPSFAGARSRVDRCRHDFHATDGGDVELDALATTQPRSAHDLHLGQLVVPVADTVDGLRSETHAAPEFTDFELRGGRHAAKYIAPSPRNVPGVDR